MEFIKAIDYGVVFDGATDDYANLQSAIDAAEGKCLLLPIGTARLSQCLSIPSNTKIIGVKGLTFLKPTNGNTSVPAIISIDTKTDITIEDVSIDGNIGSIAGFEYVVLVEDSSNIIFDGCHWTNTKGLCILFNGCENSGVKNSTFKDIGMYHLVSSNNADRRQGVCFSLGGDSNFSINNKFENTGLDSISAGTGGVGPQENLIISFNKIKTGYAGSIYISGAQGFICSENFVSNGTSGGNGIDTNDSKDGVIANNVCIGNGASGILIADGRRFTVTGNICKNNYQSGASDHKGGITISSTTGKGVRDITLSNNYSDDDQGASTTQLYAVYIDDTSGGFTRIKIDNSNHLVGRKSTGVKYDINAIGRCEFINVTEFPQTFNLDNNGSRVICTDKIRGQLHVNNLNSGYYCLSSLRYLQSPAQQLDINGHYLTADSGTGTAIYRSGTNIYLKNRTGVTRSYSISGKSMVDVE